MLIVWDRLFGTFAAERDDVPCRYGLVTPLHSNNLLVIEFHEWAALVRDVWHARSFRERVAVVAGPPDGGRPAITAEAAVPPHDDRGAVSAA